MERKIECPLADIPVFLECHEAIRTCQRQGKFLSDKVRTSVISQVSQENFVENAGPLAAGAV